jgi:creatinine amidohydrolase
MMRNHMDWLTDGGLDFNDIFFGAYDILGRLDDIPLTTGPEYDHSKADPSSHYTSIGRPSIAGCVGFYFGKRSDHAPTPRVTTAEDRRKRAESGKAMISQLVREVDITNTIDRLRELDLLHQREILPEYGDWLPPTRA